MPMLLSLLSAVTMSNGVAPILKGQAAADKANFTCLDLWTLLDCDEPVERLVAYARGFVAGEVRSLAMRRCPLL